MAKKNNALVALHLINEIKAYEIKDGQLLKNGKVLKGSIGSEDKALWYNLQGVSFLAKNLMYLHYYGPNALNGDFMVKQLDDTDPRNLRKANLIGVPKKGWKAILTEARTGLATEWVCYLPAKEVTEAPAPTVTATEQPTAQLTPKEHAMALIAEGKLTVKEIAEVTGANYKTVWNWHKKHNSK